MRQVEFRQSCTKSRPFISHSIELRGRFSLSRLRLPSSATLSWLLCSLLQITTCWLAGIKPFHYDAFLPPNNPPYNGRGSGSPNQVEREIEGEEYWTGQEERIVRWSNQKILEMYIKQSVSLPTPHQYRKKHRRRVHLRWTDWRILRGAIIGSHCSGAFSLSWLLMKHRHISDTLHFIGEWMDSIGLDDATF